MTATAPDQSIADGFKALSAGQPRAALEAVAAVDQAQHPRASLLVGHAHKALGDHAAAECAYRALAASDDRRHAATGWWSLAGLKTAQFTAADAAGLDRMIEGQEPDGYLGLMHLARAEIWHQSGLPDMAFPHLKAGNDLVAGARPFNGEAYRRLVDELLTIKTDSTGASGTEELHPIFIIGQPRSGTTLVEQILASHPNVDATDELSFMGHRGADLQREGGYAEQLAELSEDRRQIYRQQYLKVVEPYRTKRGKAFIDKAPENFLHVALILKIFPSARFVHVVRDPLDNIVSQYRHFFAEGREYSNSLEGLIFYWQGYLMLMRHWSALFPGQIYHLHYASLVASPEEQITALLGFCSLPAAPECFTPHTSERPVMTPSAAQVRQPINTAGIDSGLAYGSGLQDWLKEIGKLKEASVSLFGNS